MQNLKNCPGCDGDLHPIVYSDDQPTVAVCNGCDGLITLRPVSREYACAFIGLDSPMLANSGDVRYFDFDLKGSRRIHGWLDRASRRVVQYG